jgi:hypothetical protein
MSSDGLWENLHAGDWACAHADDAALARAATALAADLSGRQRLRALGVAAVATIDMADASRRWAELTDELRASSAEVAG